MPVLLFLLYLPQTYSLFIMKASITKYAILLIACGGIFFYQSCKKDKDPIKHKLGLFPETLVNLYDLNNTLDISDFSKHVIQGDIAIVFSTPDNQLALKQGAISYVFDQTTGDFSSAFGSTNDGFIQNLINKATGQGYNIGAYRFFCTIDGFEYFMLSSENAAGNSDFYYLRNIPMFGTNYPEIQGPLPITLLNSAANDAYICFDQDFDTAYFSSDRDGNFDIYVHSFSLEKPLNDQLNQPFIASAKPDSINSSADDMCPFIHKNVMVFASDRPGGLGGFDLYYSIFRNGKWSSPINFGPDINTEFDEYMPVLGSVTDFKNSYLLFSSDRNGSNFELYFTGINLSNLSRQ